MEYGAYPNPMFVYIYIYIYQHTPIPFPSIIWQLLKNHHGLSYPSLLFRARLGAKKHLVSEPRKTAELKDAFIKYNRKVNRSRSALEWWIPIHNSLLYPLDRWSWQFGSCIFCCLQRKGGGFIRSGFSHSPNSFVLQWINSILYYLTFVVPLYLLDFLQISEGMDFPDDRARCVIIIGIPFPPLKARRNIVSKYLCTG